MSKSISKRALALPSNDFGSLRHETYKNLIDRMKIAISSGFYLEAIALQESIIADRLESRLNFLSHSDQHSFKHLEKIVRSITKLERDPVLKNLVETAVDSWRDKRNKVLHRMAKIDETNPLTWEDKTIFAKAVAEEGVILFRDVIKAVEKLK